MIAQCGFPFLSTINDTRCECWSTSINSNVKIRKTASSLLAVPPLSLLWFGDGFHSLSGVRLVHFCVDVAFQAVCCDDGSVRCDVADEAIMLMTGNVTSLLLAWEQYLGLLGLAMLHLEKHKEVVKNAFSVF